MRHTRQTKRNIIERLDILLARLRGPATRSNYWSNSQFASWVQKRMGITKKPWADTMEGWRTWRNANEGKIGYVITEDVFDLVQDIVMLPSDLWNRFRYYVKNRFFDKLHYLPTKLKPGQYYEVDTRVVHGLMETLVDFVEVEKAHMYWITYAPSAKKTREWFMNGTRPDIIPKPLMHRFWALRFYSDRSAAAGLHYLKWETTLDTPEANGDYPGWQPPEQGVMTQARAAAEIIELYNWWKNVRQNRLDPMDISGWTTYCSERDIWNDEEKTEEGRAKTKAMLDEMTTIEQQYDEEDEQMLIRLIKVRKYMWT